MSQTTAPTPSTPPAGSASAPAPAGRDHSLRIALIALGSALVIALIALGGTQVALAATGGDDSGTYSESARFSELEIDTSAADVTVRYGAVSETRIEFDSGGAPLRYEQRIDGDTLELGVKSRGWWLFGVIGGFGFDRDAHLEITLPAALAPLDVSVDSSAGDTDLDGDFGALELDSSAGSIRLAGSATSLSAESSAGSINGFELDVSGAVETEASAGATEFSFVTLPSSIRMAASAGGIRVALPSGEYELIVDALGSVEQGLVSTAGSSRVYSFETSAGNVVLRPYTK